MSVPNILAIIGLVAPILIFTAAMLIRRSREP